MFKAQGGVCAICGDDPSVRRAKGAGGRLHIDHCHKTKAVRGLLCPSCNRALGWFRDRTDLLEKAIHYLKPDFHWTGKGNATKEQMILTAQKRGFNPKDDNEADALAILSLARGIEKPTFSNEAQKLYFASAARIDEIRTPFDRR